MLKQQIDQDIKTALLSGDQDTANVLRGLKSAILYSEVSLNLRDEGLDDASIIKVLSKESKKRGESAELYLKGCNQERADAELKERAIIDNYLPEQISEEDIAKLVYKTIESMGNVGLTDMGKVIGKVKQEAGPNADGSKIAKIVKNKLSEKK